MSWFDLRWRCSLDLDVFVWSRRWRKVMFIERVCVGRVCNWGPVTFLFTFREIASAFLESKVNKDKLYARARPRQCHQPSWQALLCSALLWNTFVRSFVRGRHSSRLVSYACFKHMTNTLFRHLSVKPACFMP